MLKRNQNIVRKKVIRHIKQYGRLEREKQKCIEYLNIYYYLEKP